MRRRQQDLPVQTQKVVDQKHHEKIDNVLHSSRRSTRRSPALILIAFGVAIVFFIICYALHNSFGTDTDTDASSLHQEISSPQSLRSGGGNNKSIDNSKQHRRVVAVGDIHGDKDALIHALQLAKLVDQDTGMKWIGGSDIVVQIGDLLNKAEARDQETLEYMVHIEREASSAGGTLIVTVGDHDLHNAPKLWNEMKDQFKNNAFPSWMHAAYIVERTLFVHGSLSKTVFDTIGGSIDKMNKEAQAWLAGKGEKPKWIGRGDGPIWSRLYSDKASDENDPSASTHYCDELFHLLNELSVDRMIVGHTVKRQGISAICNNQVWRIDVGLSRTETRAGKIGASEVLEMLTDSAGNTVANVLSADTKLKSWK